MDGERLRDDPGVETTAGKCTLDPFLARCNLAASPLKRGAGLSSDVRQRPAAALSAPPFISSF